jgi:hypothetical protein
MGGIMSSCAKPSCLPVRISDEAECGTEADSAGKVVVRMRPEAERRLREGFQRRVDEQSSRYAGQLAHARQQGARFECGEVAGVFTAEAGGEPTTRTYVVALLPIAALPLVIALPATGIPGTLQFLIAYPFLAGAWIGLGFWLGREPKRRVWLYAFTEGFMLLDGPGDAMPVLWSQVTGVGPVWTNTYLPGDEDHPRPVLSAYRLRLADGRVQDISSSLKNVQDPYGEMGQLFRGLSPGVVGKTMPRLPTIGEVIATYAGVK